VDICGYNGICLDMKRQTAMDKGGILMDMSWISFHIQKDILSYPKRYPFISKKISFNIHKRYP
jgi:hypothetical protein